MKYTVNKLAKASGVTIRTLHHYDYLELLTPTRGENDYRYYEEGDLLRLQQILLYRDLGFPLTTIKEILDNPSFDYLQALFEHKQALLKQKGRVEEILKTIDKTIKNLKRGDSMNAQDLYGGLTKKQMEEYQKEAKERWGSTAAYQQSIVRVSAMGKAGLEKIGREMQSTENELASLMGEKDINSPEVQAVVAKHRANLTNFYDVSDEMYSGIAHMYVEDPRFTAHYDAVKPGLAQFLSQAMLASLVPSQK